MVFRNEPRRADAEEDQVSRAYVPDALRGSGRDVYHVEG